MFPLHIYLASFNTYAEIADLFDKGHWIPLESLTAGAHAAAEIIDKCGDIECIYDVAQHVRRMIRAHIAVDAPTQAILNKYFESGQYSYFAYEICGVCIDAQLNCKGKGKGKGKSKSKSKRSKGLGKRSMS